MLYFPLTKSLDKKITEFQNSANQHSYTEPHILVSVGRTFCSDYKCHPSITIMLISRSGDKIGNIDFLDLSELNKNESKKLLNNTKKSSLRLIINIFQILIVVYTKKQLTTITFISKNNATS